MLILLGVSTGLAIVAPDPRERESTEETTPTGATGATGAGQDGDAPDPDEGADSGPAMVEVAVKPGSKDQPIEARAGDRLVLSVQTEEPSVVEIPELGLTGTTSDFAPAVFDVILPEEPGRIEVTTVDGEQPVATIDTGT